MKDEEEKEGMQLDPFHLTVRESSIAKLLSNSISVSVDKKTGLTTLSVTMQDARIAACLTDSVMCRLQNYVTNYRTNKARQDFEFQKGLFERKKKEYEIAQGNYAKFADALASGESKVGYRLLKPETVTLMKSNQLCEIGLNNFRTNTNNKGYGYGMGVRTLMDRKIENTISPIGEFGWDGAAGAYCLIDTDNRLSIFYAQHVNGCSYVYSHVHKAIRNLVYKALEK